MQRRIRQLSAGCAAVMLTAMAGAPRAGAVEPGFKEVQVNSGYTIVADEDMEIRRTGGHIVIEDQSTANSKKIRRLQEELAKLRAENQELRASLQKFETALKDRLRQVETALADLRAQVGMPE